MQFLLTNHFYFALKYQFKLILCLHHLSTIILETHQFIWYQKTCLQFLKNGYQIKEVICHQIAEKHYCQINSLNFWFCQNNHMKITLFIVTHLIYRQLIICKKFLILQRLYYNLFEALKLFYHFPQKKYYSFIEFQLMNFHEMKRFLKTYCVLDYLLNFNLIFHFNLKFQAKKQVLLLQFL